MNAWQRNFLAKEHCNTIMGGGGGVLMKIRKVKKYSILNVHPGCTISSCIPHTTHKSYSTSRHVFKFKLHAKVI